MIQDGMKITHGSLNAETGEFTPPVDAETREDILSLLDRLQSRDGFEVSETVHIYYDAETRTLTLRDLSEAPK